MPYSRTGPQRGRSFNLTEQLEELRRRQAVMPHRADHGMKLKREVHKLLRRLGEPIRYPSKAEARAKTPEA
jgi:hypothetical protein